MPENPVDRYSQPDPRYEDLIEALQQEFGGEKRYWRKLLHHGENYGLNPEKFREILLLTPNELKERFKRLLWEV